MCKCTNMARGYAYFAFNQLPHTYPVSTGYYMRETVIIWRHINMRCILTYTRMCILYVFIYVCGRSPLRSIVLVHFATCSRYACYFQFPSRMWAPITPWCYIQQLMSHQTLVADCNKFYPSSQFFNQETRILGTTLTIYCPIEHEYFR